MVIFKRDATIEELLVYCASGIVLASGQGDPWDYGWSQESYRRSEHASFSSSGAPVRLVGERLEAYELAVKKLAKDQNIKKRWLKDEIWSAVMRIVVAAHESGDTANSVALGVRGLREAPPVTVVLSIANVKWDGDPVHLAGVVIGRAERAWSDMVHREFGRGLEVPAEEFSRLLEEVLRENSGGLLDDVVVMACSVTGQGGLSEEQASRRLENVLDIAILLEPDLSRLKMFSLRGSVNRPGLRGVQIDRSAMEKLLREARGAHELAARPVALGPQGINNPVMWYNADPVPLSRLLQAGDRRTDVDQICLGEDLIASRLRVAARWHAEAHWAEREDDAVLALGVALDSLIGSTGGLPGRVMSDRYALLEPDPVVRAERAKTYARLYRVRSVVAHGGVSRELDERDFVREMSAHVRWVARRMIGFRSEFSPQNEQELDGIFDDLRWGVRSWSSPHSS